MEGRFRSYAEQTLGYFDRPHTAVLDRPLEVAAAWRGSEVRKDPTWRHRLSPDQIAEVEASLAGVRAAGRRAGDLAREDLPWPSLAGPLARWREDLDRGRGLVLISGVPVERWDQADTETFFWALGLHLGRPGAQNPDGDLLGHVADTGEDARDPMVRLYRTSADIAFHCDAADAVGLLCLRRAKRGGLSRIASSVTVWNELVRRRPDLAARLFEPFALDIRNEERPGMKGWIPIPPCRFDGERLRTFFHSDYFRSASRHADAPRLCADEHELLDLYEEIAGSEDVRLDMDLQPGDVQLISNHTVIHARTGYEDDPGARRHLLRLWLSL